MPSFNILIISGPLGFTQFCKDLNELVKDEIKFNEIVSNSFSSIITNSALPIGNNKIENNCINGVAFICRCCIQAAPTPEDKEIAISLNNNTTLSRKVIESLVVIYNEMKENTTVLTPKNSVGQLTDVTWKLGVALQSSQCAQLLTPFVSLQLRVSDARGRSCTHPLEMTPAQFAALRSTVAEIVAEMDAL